MEAGSSGLSTATMPDRDRGDGQDATFEQLAFQHLVLH